MLNDSTLDWVLGFIVLALLFFIFPLNVQAHGNHKHNWLSWLFRIIGIYVALRMFGVVKWTPF